MSATLFFLLLLYAVTIAAFMIDVMGTINSFGLTFFATLTGLLNILMQMIIYCQLSENVTLDLLAAGDIFYESLWYRLPVRVQKLYMLPIQRSQREFRVTGLGIIECSLRVFASVRFTF